MDFRGQKLILLSGDVILMYVSLFLVLMVRFGEDFNEGVVYQHLPAFTFLYLIWFVIFYVFDAYELSSRVSLKRVSQFSVALVVAFLVGVLYFYTISFSSISPKVILLFHVLVFGVLSLIWRRVFFSNMARIAPLVIGVVGSHEEVDELQSMIRDRTHLGHVCVPLRSAEHLSFHIQEQKLNMVVLPSVNLSDPVGAQQIYACLGKGVIFLDTAQAYELFAKRIPLSTVDHRWFLRNIQEKDASLYQHVKRFFDVSVSLFLLGLTAPLWLVLVTAIKFSDGGSVFYTQERMGKNGTLFSIIKFRTMWVDAESNGPAWATKQDARVTAVGRILRKTHLDELPQLLNVLRGDLSLVGPRPERPVFVDLLEAEIPYYHVRHFIKPGITGWAQIKFRYARSVVDSQMKFEYDLYYIKNRSFLFDILILLKTTHFFLRGES